MSVRPPGPKPAFVLHDGAESLDGGTFKDALDESARLPPETRSVVALHFLSDMSDHHVLWYSWVDPGAFVDHHLTQRADAAAKARSDFYAQEKNLAGGAIELEDAMDVLTPQLRSLPAGRSNEVIRKLTDAGEFERSEAVGPVAEHWDTMSGSQQDAVLASMEAIQNPAYRLTAYVNLSKGWKYQSDLQHEWLLTRALNFKEFARGRLLGEIAEHAWSDMKDEPRSRVLAGIEAITDPNARSEAFPGLLKVWRSMESDERHRVWALLPNDENRPKGLTLFAPVWRDLDEPWQDEVLHGALSPVLTPQERTEALIDLAPQMADSSLERQMLWAQGVSRLAPPDHADPQASIRREAPWMREDVMFAADLARIQPETRQFLLQHAVPGTANEDVLRNRLQQSGASS